VELAQRVALTQQKNEELKNAIQQARLDMQKALAQNDSKAAESALIQKDLDA
jgi:hypothetical protein